MSNETCNTDKEVERGYYLELLKELKEKESNFIQFLAIILPGITIFALGIEKYLQNSDGKLEYLVLPAMGAIFIFFCGIIFALALSYSHRNIQLVLSKFEKNLCLSQKIPSSWNLLNKKELNNCCSCLLFSFAPTIYQYFIFLSFVSIVSITGVVVYFELILILV